MLRELGSFEFGCVAIGIFGPIVAIIIDWPLVAVLEAYGIAMIDAWIIIMLRVLAWGTAEGET